MLVDANFLVAWVSPKTSKDDKARLEFFLSQAEKEKSRIIIPMPVVAEYLVRADEAGLEFFNKIEKKAFIFLAPFDRVAAFECAQIDRAALLRGDKKDGVDAPWQKIKVDRQNLAIGKACGATLVISGDGDVRKTALRIGIAAKTIAELDLPDSARQADLDLVIQIPEKTAAAGSPLL